MSNEDNWWQSFYEETPFEILFERHDRKELEATVNFIIDKLEIEKGSLVFDQCCGHGTLSQVLSERGFTVIGVDLCAKFINLAKHNAKGLNATFTQGDAFYFVPASLCDGAFNWYTSFGYASDDNVNMQMLKRGYEALKSGAIFLLDYPNIDWLLRNFKERLEKKQDSNDGEITLWRDCRIDSKNNVMEQTWTYNFSSRKSLVKDSRLKLYLPDHLSELFQKCGFTDIELCGENGKLLNQDSERCIVRGRR